MGRQQSQRDARGGEWRWRASSGALVSAHELLTSAPPYVPLLRTQPLAFEHLNRTRRAVVTGVQSAHLRQHPLRFNSAAAVPHLPRPVVSDASDRREGNRQAGTGSTCEARTGFGTSRSPPVVS